MVRWTLAKPTAVLYSPAHRFYTPDFAASVSNTAGRFASHS